MPVTVAQSGVNVSVGGGSPVTVSAGTPGPPGPLGANIAVVLVPFAEWPPVNPQSNTLYLRLAP